MNSNVLYLTPEDITEDVVIIKINQSYNPLMSTLELYDITRGCWRRKIESVSSAKYALAAYKGEVVEVYKIDYWCPASELNRETLPYNPERQWNRIGFFGSVAEKSVREKFIGKSVKHFYKRGEADPVKLIKAIDPNLNHFVIKQCVIENLPLYAHIYAKAFSGAPWYDPWKEEDAAIHIKEILEQRQSYGLECLVDGEVAGFILGSSKLFHYGRSFEINDMAVDPKYQRLGIACKLLEQLLGDLKRQGIVDVNLITAREGALPEYYEKFGFQKAKEVALMGRKL